MNKEISIHFMTLMGGFADFDTLPPVSARHADLFDHMACHFSIFGRNSNILRAPLSKKKKKSEIGQVCYSSLIVPMWRIFSTFHFYLTQVMKWSFWHSNKLMLKYYLESLHILCQHKTATTAGDDIMGLMRTCCSQHKSTFTLVTVE